MLCLDGPNGSVQTGKETRIFEETKFETGSGKSSAQLVAERDRRRVIIVGIPGVGKTTVVNRLVELLKERKVDLDLVNYGSTMMEEATQRHGLKSRDEMRKLPVELQRSLQIYAAERISLMESAFVIVDTHLFIVTKEGFWPGMPLDVLRALKPTQLVLVAATLEEIKFRRENDATRTRDTATLESLELEMEAAKSLLFASSLVCGCPALIVTNSTGQSDNAAKKIMSSVF